MTDTISRLALVAAATLAAPAAASTFAANDFNGVRGLWTSGLVRDAGGGMLGGAFSQWALSGSTFVTDATGASLTGRATNTGDSAIFLDFDIRLENETNPGEGYCQYGGAPFACTEGLTNGKGTVVQAPLDPSVIAGWDFYTFGTTTTLTGGGEMAGLVLTIGDATNGQHLPQAGIGANAFDRDDLGFSAWFSWTSTGAATSSTYSFLASSADDKNGHGDFNIDLVAQTGVSEVPLPAGLPLLLAGLGGLGLAARRRA